HPGQVGQVTADQVRLLGAVEPGVMVAATREQALELRGGQRKVRSEIALGFGQRGDGSESFEPAQIAQPLLSGGNRQLAREALNAVPEDARHEMLVSFGFETRQMLAIAAEDFISAHAIK